MLWNLGIVPFDAVAASCLWQCSAAGFDGEYDCTVSKWKTVWLLPKNCCYLGLCWHIFLSGWWAHSSGCGLFPVYSNPERLPFQQIRIMCCSRACQNPGLSMIWQAIDAKTKIVGIHRHRLERFVHPFLHLSRFCAIRPAHWDAASV